MWEENLWISVFNNKNYYLMGMYEEFCALYGYNKILVYEELKMKLGKYV